MLKAKEDLKNGASDVLTKENYQQRYLDDSSYINLSKKMKPPSSKNISSLITSMKSSKKKTE